MSQIKSIKCTHCSAPLNLLGGGRVESITCSYCNSVLDLNDEYKVLSNFKKIQEAHTLPFKIGMQGNLKEIDYTIIGRITYRAVDYPYAEWTDFLLFSALYGYAYLTYEEGHLIYSKRKRDFPNLTWTQIKRQSQFIINHKLYQPFDEYDARVNYVEGELTWVAKLHDKTSFIDLTSPPFGISVEKTKREIEYYDAEYLDTAMVYEAFNIEIQAPPKSFHALEPFEKPFLKSLSYIAFIVLFIITLLFVALKLDGTGKVIKSISSDNKAVKHVDFILSSNKYLVDLEVKSNTAKSLKNFNIQIHKDKQIIFSLSPLLAYHFDKTSQNIINKFHFREKKAKKVLISLNLEELGSYHLSIKPVDMNLSSTISLSIKEARPRFNYLSWFFIFTLFSWFMYKFAQWRYKLKVEDERGIYLDDDQSEGSGTSFQISMLLMLFSLLIIIAFSN